MALKKSEAQSKTQSESISKIPALALPKIIPTSPSPSLTSLSNGAIDVANETIITSRLSYSSADSLRSSYKDAISEIDNELGGVSKTLWALARSLSATIKKWTSPLEEAVSIINRKMLDFEESDREKQRQLARALEAAAQQEVEDEVTNRVAELVSNGQNEEARKLLNDLEEYIPETIEVIPIKIDSELSSTRYLKRFNILDESKIKRAFMMPNLALIQTAITQHEKRAEIIVGEGSIEFLKVPIKADKRKREE